ncbi:MAG: DNA-binding protein WhiA [Metamycoplasmataceae bacterium]
MKKNFTQEIKEELLFKKRSIKETNSFLKGIFFALFKNNVEEIKINFRNKIIKDKIIEILEEAKFSYIGFNPLNIVIDNPSHFFAGIFVASGSISPLNSSMYHIQFQVKNKVILKIIEEKLNKHNLLFQNIIKNNSFIFYGKKNELITDFLSAIGANNSFFKFTDSVIERDYNNQLNRISNLDIHNQNKLVDSNAIFKDYYLSIKNNKLENKFKKEELLFFEFKLANPFLPLSQICLDFEKEYKIKKTKSGLNHWLIKLRRIVEDYEYKISLKK